MQHKLAKLRAVQTGSKEFRELVKEISMLLTYEATQDLGLNTIDVITPMGQTTGQELQKQIGLIPILRAGLGMVEGVLEMLPFSQVWHIGLFRNEETLQPVEYYNKLPEVPTVQLGLVLDPMLATGGSAVATIDILKRHGLTDIKYLGIIAAPEGIATLHQAHPDVNIYVGNIDEHLNEIGYIVPGLGDAGDRQFGTTG